MPGEERHQHAAHHHKVEVRHDEVGLGQVNVGARRAKKDARHAADGEQAHEAEGVEHRRLKGDGPLVEREGPVEDLDRRGHRNQHGEQREHQHRVVRDAHDEHVMRPDKEAEDRDRHRRERNRRIAEDALAAEGRNHFGDHAHAGQNHDVDGGMRVEPEQVLEQKRIAALGRIEDADADRALQNDQHEGDGQHRRAQHHQDAGRIVRPHKQRQPEPGHARRAHLVDGDDEIQARKDGAESGNEDRQAGRDHVGVHVVRRERRGEGPARIHAAGGHRVDAP